jgi:hypothetical protein
MPVGPVGVDFYRQVLDLTLRGKREYTAAILSAMGGINRKQFSRYKALLRLSDEAFELADRHNIDEYVLRQILDMPSEDHVEIVRHVINFGLTAKQVKEMCHPTKAIQSNQSELPKHTRQLVKLMKSIGSSTAEDVARGLLEQETDANIARARLSSLKRLLEAAESYLTE